MRLGRVRFESKYLAIQFFYAEKGWSIRWMCRHLGISKAAYYKWLHRSVPQAEQENQRILAQAEELAAQYNYEDAILLLDSMGDLTQHQDLQA